MTTAKRVLIVEDEAHVRRMMQMALESAGLVAITADDGPTGLAAFGTGAGWSAVVLDQRMPGMEGLEVLRQIKTRTARVPVIMVTAYPSIDLAVDAMKLGATDFVRKPLTPDVLRAAVASATRDRQADEVEPRLSTTAAVEIETLTMNGFRLVELPSTLGDPRHRFRVMHGSSDEGVEVVIPIEAEAVKRLNRLSDRHHDPGGSFWSSRAEELLASFLWAEGRIPPPGTLSVKDCSREELDIARAWPASLP